MSERAERYAGDGDAEMDLDDGMHAQLTLQTLVCGGAGAALSLAPPRTSMG